MNTVYKWPSIEQLPSLRKTLRHLNKIGQPYPHRRYRAKVKLDGTNVGVQIHPDGRIFAQSRNRLLTIKDDQMGFAKFVSENEGYFLDPLWYHPFPFVIYGEWCGSGIQKRCSISQIDRKVFSVFGVRIGAGGLSDESRIEVEPEEIKHFLPPRHPNTFILPWMFSDFEIDFSDRDSLEAAANLLNGWVSEVEKCDPWVKDTFGVEGLGEGLVLYPYPHGDFDPKLMFKAKGDEHKTVMQGKAVQVDPSVAKSTRDFASMMVTEARCLQGWQEVGSPEDMRGLGSFLKWLGSDIQKEGQAEIEASGLTWKQVAKEVSTAGRAWYLKNLGDR